jgi:hypothetical protein
MLSAPEQRALAAASTVASAQGLKLDAAVVIYSESNVLVHLRPAPVVARVMTGTVALHDDPRRWLEREVSVLEFLMPSGLAVSPSRLIAPGPHYHDGLWMTFTEWVPEVEPDLEIDSAVSVDDARELGRMLRYLHDALRPCDRELGGSPELRDDIERLLGQLRSADAQQRAAISSLGERLNALGTVVFDSSLRPRRCTGTSRCATCFAPGAASSGTTSRTRFAARSTGTWRAPSAVSAPAERTRAASARCSTATSFLACCSLLLSGHLMQGKRRF